MHLNREQQLLVENNLALVRKVISDKVRGVRKIGVFGYEDLYQIGCIGLCKAVYSYKHHNTSNKENEDSENSRYFSTYAYRSIWNEICTMLYYATKVRVEAMTDPSIIRTVGQAAEIDSDDVFSTIDEKASLSSALDRALESTSGVKAKGIQAIKLMAEGYTATEIGEIMGGVPRNNVTAWVSRARKHLKSMPEITGVFAPEKTGAA